MYDFDVMLLDIEFTKVLQRQVRLQLPSCLFRQLKVSAMVKVRVMVRVKIAVMLVFWHIKSNYATVFLSDGKIDIPYLIHYFFGWRKNRCQVIFPSDGKIAISYLIRYFSVWRKNRRRTIFPSDGKIATAFNIGVESIFPRSQIIFTSIFSNGLI